MRIFLLGLINLLFHVCAGEKDGSGLTPEQRAQFDSKAEKHEFKSEVNRAMDIIIHSLYSERQIFLRELISNAADASDKLRHLALTNPSLLKENEELDIRIVADNAKKTLTITDRGLGMTKEQLVSNLGIVAKSGTTEFVNAAEKAGANKPNLIGQFGVGFYSAYLVADRVTVISKSDEDPKQHIWESNAQGQFTVAADPRGNTLGRGTSVILHLKEDAEDYLKPEELTKIAQQYSSFITFPILLQKSKEVEREIPNDEVEEETKKEETPKEGEDDIEISDDEGTEEKKPATKKIKETVLEWEHLNKVLPVWTRPAKDVTEQEYKDFFNALTKDSSPDGYLEKLHFSTEGDSPFKALLFIPKKAEITSQNELFSLKKSNVALYVKHVLIADQFEDFLPRYMNFVRGIVEADNIPINVSRETLAQIQQLQTIAKKIIKKVLDLLTKMAASGKAKATEEKTEEETEKTEDKEVTSTEYETFWSEYGKSIKFGVIDDRKNRAKLVSLLRFRTSSSEGKEVSLESYVSRMKEGQKRIYYMTGESDDKIKKSPFLEKVIEKGYEVIFMSDPLDEYVVGAVPDFDGVELQSVTKENLKLDEDDKESLKKDKETYKPLTDWFSKVYGNQVEKVVVSNRLGSSPCVLVTGQYGMTANMQRIVKGSTLQSHEGMMTPKKTLEINVHHPILKAINAKIVEDAEDASLIDMANILLDSALVTSGFTVTDYAPFYHRMTKVISAGLGLDPNAKAEEETPDEPEDEEEESEPKPEKKPKRKSQTEDDAHDEL